MNFLLSFWNLILEFLKNAHRFSCPRHPSTVWRQLYHGMSATAVQLNHVHFESVPPEAGAIMEILQKHIEKTYRWMNEISLKWITGFSPFSPGTQWKICWQSWWCFLWVTDVSNVSSTFRAILKGHTVLQIALIDKVFGTVK